MLGYHRHNFVMQTELPPFKVGGTSNLAAANPSTFTASVCSERTAGPQCKQAPSGRGTPVVSQTDVETPTRAPSRSATLARFHTTECTDQTTCPAEQNRALVGLGPRCSVVLCKQRSPATCAMPPAPPQAHWAEAYTGSSSASTRCGPAVQPGSLRLGKTSGVSQGGERTEPMHWGYSFHWRGDAQALAPGSIAVGSQALHTFALVRMARSAWRSM